MSAPAEAGPSAPKDKSKRLSRLITYVKTVIKKPGDKRKSFMSTKEAPIDIGSKQTPAPPAEAGAAGEQATKVQLSHIYEERAQRLAERYGLTLTPGDWYETDGTALRVDRPVRMRVRRTCHQCGSFYGNKRDCPKCNHSRCDECQRYPPKRTEEERQASRQHRAAIKREREENPPLEPSYGPSKPIPITRPHPSGKGELVHKKPRQRVRRTCHVCSTTFGARSRTCTNCGHPRCTDCPRDPCKKDKYPYGYPGDEWGPNSIPHHTCHQCGAKYEGGAPDGTECATCKHPKCGDCPRLKPVKVEPEGDPEVLKSLETKVAALKAG